MLSGKKTNGVTTTYVTAFVFTFAHLLSLLCYGSTSFLNLNTNDKGKDAGREESNFSFLFKNKPKLKVVKSLFFVMICVNTLIFIFMCSIQAILAYVASNHNKFTINNR